MKAIVFFIFVAIVICFMSHILAQSVDESWEYLSWPSKEGRYLIRIESGEEMQADFKGDSWYDLDNRQIDSHIVDCWKEL